MDLRMPEMSGVEAIRAIRGFSQQGRFIVLTTYQGDEDIHKALAAGAQAYLLKGMPHENCSRRFAAFTRAAATCRPPDEKPG